MPQSDYPILRAEIARARKRFLAPSAVKQTGNYDIKCSNLYLYILYIYYIYKCIIYNIYITYIYIYIIYIYDVMMLEKLNIK